MCLTTCAVRCGCALNTGHKAPTSHTWPLLPPCSAIFNPSLVSLGLLLNIQQAILSILIWPTHTRPRFKTCLKPLRLKLQSSCYWASTHWHNDPLCCPGCWRSSHLVQMQQDSSSCYVLVMLTVLSLSQSGLSSSAWLPGSLQVQTITHTHTHIQVFRCSWMMFRKKIM